MITSLGATDANLTTVPATSLYTLFTWFIQVSKCLRENHINTHRYWWYINLITNSVLHGTKVSRTQNRLCKNLLLVLELNSRDPLKIFFIYCTLNTSQLTNNDQKLAVLSHVGSNRFTVYLCGQSFSICIMIITDWWVVM